MARSSRKRLLLLIIIVLVFIIFGALLMFLMKRGGSKSVYIKNQEERQNELKNKKDSIYNSIANAGAKYNIHPEDILPDITRPPGYQDEEVCVVYPKNGKCDDRYYDLKNKCCELRDNSEEAAKAEKLRAMKKLGLEVGISIVAEELLTTVMPQIINGKYGAKLATLADDAAKAGSRAAPKLGRVLAYVARRMGLEILKRAALLTMRLMAKLGSGPVGWATMVLDVFTILADMGDGENYDSWIENKMFIDMRNRIVYEMYTVLKREGSELPVMFPLYMAYGSEMEAVYSTLFAEYQPKITEYLIKNDKGGPILQKILNTALKIEEGESVDMSDSFTDVELGAIDFIIQELRNENTVEHDKKLFEHLQTQLGETRKTDIFLVPSMSSKNSVGISLSKEAAEKWNNNNKESWFMWNDLFFPPNRPEDYAEPMVAIYTDTYLTHDPNNPGTVDKPTVINIKLPQPVTLMYPFGMLVATCEKPRTSNKYKDPIDPTSYGVTFDYSNGVCDFTKQYCRRYGLDRTQKQWGETIYHDCKKKTGQAAAEAVLGPTLTRASIRTWDERKDDFRSGDPKRVLEAAVMTVIDPTGLSEGGVRTGIDTFNRRQDEYNPAEQAVLTVVDPLGISENFVRGMGEKLAGRDKYCLSGDTCKKFHAKHNGGNFMNWSVRGKDGSIYSNGLAFQNQVKDSEDHTFYIPEDGYFKVSCQPGEKRDFTYNEVTDPFKVSCTLGKIKINRSRSDQALDVARAAGNAALSAGTGAYNATIGQTVGLVEQVAKDPLGTAKDAGNAVAGVVTDPLGTAKDAANKVAGVVTDPVGTANDAWNKAKGIFR